MPPSPVNCKGNEKINYLSAGTWRANVGPGADDFVRPPFPSRKKVKIFEYKYKMQQQQYL
jgi:hypothetical protein